MTAFFAAPAEPAPAVIRLAYARQGQGDPPLVFVHGWCCDRSHFAPQVEHFARAHATLSLDLRGHGESDRPAPGADVYSIDAFARDVVALASAAGLVRPVVVGHSLGGLVALACAARPESVRAAVVINPAITGDPRTQTFFTQSFDAIANDDSGAWRAAFATRLMLPTDRANRAEILASVARTPPRIAAAVWQTMQRYDGLAALDRIRVPLLAIGSSHVDTSLLARDRSVTMGQTVGAGHFNQLEVPTQVNAMIERFLSLHAR